MQIKIRHLIPHPLKEFGFEESMIWDKTYRFDQGKYYQLVAASGIGKSTFINILYGIRHDYEGEVRFDQQNIRDLKEKDWTKIRNTKLGYVFQGLHLFEELSLMENIQLKNKLTNFASVEQIEHWIERVGLSQHLYKKTQLLSYGQRQRIAIVRALCQPFDFLLLDEPFSHLDKENQTLLLDLIIEVVEKQKAGIIVTSLHTITDKRIDHVVEL